VRCRCGCSDGSYRYKGLGELVTAVRRRLTRAVVGTVGGLVPWGYLPFGGGKDKDKPQDPYTPGAGRCTGAYIY
jgi:hypothetical protein